MNRQQTLETLRTLKLSAMADVYEASMRLGPNDAPTTGELIAHMAEAEWNVRKQRKTDRLLRQATLRIPATVDAIEFSPERNLDRDTLRNLVTMEWVERGETIKSTTSHSRGRFCSTRNTRGTSSRTSTCSMPQTSWPN